METNIHTALFYQRTYWSSGSPLLSVMPPLWGLKFFHAPRIRSHPVIVIQVWLLFHVLYKDINKWPELQKSVCWKPKPMYIISAVMS